MIGSGRERRRHDVDGAGDATVPRRGRRAAGCSADGVRADLDAVVHEEVPARRLLQPESGLPSGEPLPAMHAVGVPLPQLLRVFFLAARSRKDPGIDDFAAHRAGPDRRVGTAVVEVRATRGTCHAALPRRLRGGSRRALGRSCLTARGLPCTGSRALSRAQMSRHGRRRISPRTPCC